MPYNRATCSAFGSAQQYQGSFEIRNRRIATAALARHELQARERADRVEQLAHAAAVRRVPTIVMIAVCSAIDARVARGATDTSATVDRTAETRRRMSSSSSSREPSVTSSRSPHCTGATCSTRSSAATRVAADRRYAAIVVHGVNATNVGDQQQSGVPAEADRLEEIRARVPLLQLREHVVVNRLDGARDEQAPGLRQHRQQVAMLQQMLDLDRDVVGHAPDGAACSCSTMRRA